MKNKRWRDKATLYELYHGQRMDKEEMGTQLGCSGATVSNWMDRLGVPSVRAEERASYLRHLYVEKRMTQEEIADLINTPQTTISTYLNEAGIEIRTSLDYTHPSIYFSGDGYLTCRHRDVNRRKAFRVHRLQAVAYHGFDEVAGNQVHHKNGVRWDNRMENLEVLSHPDHLKRHHEQEDIRPPQLRD